jgi:hypothetical protein
MVQDGAYTLLATHSTGIPELREPCEGSEKGGGEIP